MFKLKLLMTYNSYIYLSWFLADLVNTTNE